MEWMALKKRCIIVLLQLLAAIPLHTVLAQTDVPPGYKLIAADRGVELYRKNYQGGSPDYVQVIDFTQGAAVELMHGPIKEPRQGKGVYGGDDPRMGSKSIQQYWKEFASENPTAFCVNTGEFFYMPEYPTRLAFPLKKDGVRVTDGFGYNTYEGHHMMLELWPDRADINPLTPERLQGSTAPNIISGLSEEANKRAKQYTGRTFVGVDDRDGNGTYEILLIVSTRSARQVDAAQVLRSFGADKVMMLDGGGSAQLYCRGEAYVYSERLLPQVIGVKAGVNQPYLAALVDVPPAAAVNAGERLDLQIQALNQGSEVWRAGEVELVVEKQHWGSDERLPLAADVQPGEHAVFPWAVGIFDTPGDFAARVYLVRGGEVITPQPQTVQISVAAPVAAEVQAAGTDQVAVDTAPAETLPEPAETEAAGTEQPAGVDPAAQHPVDGTAAQPAPESAAGTMTDEAGAVLQIGEPIEVEAPAATQTSLPLALAQGTFAQANTLPGVQASIERIRMKEAEEASPNLADVFWIPLVFSPLIAVLARLITARQRRAYQVYYYDPRGWRG